MRTDTVRKGRIGILTDELMGFRGAVPLLQMVACGFSGLVVMSVVVGVCLSVTQNEETLCRAGHRAEPLMKDLS